VSRAAANGARIPAVGSGGHQATLGVAPSGGPLTSLAGQAGAGVHLRTPPGAGPHPAPAALEGPARPEAVDEEGGLPALPQHGDRGWGPLRRPWMNSVPPSPVNVPLKLHGVPPVVPSKCQPPPSGRTRTHCGSVGQTNSRHWYGVGVW